MRWIVLVLVGALMAGCADKAQDAADQAADAAPVGSLPGVVVDIAVQPLADATVVAQPGGHSVTTDANGAFRFDDLEPGTYALTASKPGFLDTTRVASVFSDRPSPVAKLVLDHNPEAAQYVTLYQFKGFLECAVFPINWCGQVNIASIILCEGYGVCVGPITTDRSLALHWLDAIPDFLQTEMVWTAGSNLGERFLFVVGAATEAEIASGFVAALNRTRGPSPLMLQIHGEELHEHSIGGERALLTQLHPSPQHEIPGGCIIYNPCGPSVHFMQDYEYFTHTFFGFEPPDGWLFARDGPPPGP